MATTTTTTPSISTSINNSSSSNITHLHLSNDLTLSTNPYRTVEATAVTVEDLFTTSNIIIFSHR